MACVVVGNDASKLQATRKGGPQQHGGAVTVIRSSLAAGPRYNMHQANQASCIMHLANSQSSQTDQLGFNMHACDQHHPAGASACTLPQEHLAVPRESAPKQLWTIMRQGPLRQQLLYLSIQNRRDRCHLRSHLDYSSMPPVQQCQVSSSMPCCTQRHF